MAATTQLLFFTKTKDFSLLTAALLPAMCLWALPCPRRIISLMCFHKYIRAGVPNVTHSTPHYFSLYSKIRINSTRFQNIFHHLFNN